MWEELGIAPTSDAAEIRRAYAGKLRSIDPDADPAAFGRLRNAYEMALRYEARPVPPVPAVAVDDHRLEPAEVSVQVDVAELTQPVVPRSRVAVARATSEDSPLDAITSEATRERRKASKAINDALSIGDISAAVSAYDHGLARGLFPITQRETTVEKVMEAALTDPSLAPHEFMRLMDHFGWNRVQRGSEHVSAIRYRAMLRAEAEMWLGHLTAVADGRSVWNEIRPWHRGNSLNRWIFHHSDRMAAQILLGRRPFTVPTAKVAAMIEKMTRQYRNYQPWLESRLAKGIAQGDRAIRNADTWGGAVAFFRWAFMVAIGLVIIGALVAVGMPPIAGVLVFIAIRVVMSLR